MTKTRFINPLLQRTEERGEQPPAPAAQAAVAPAATPTPPPASPPAPPPTPAPAAAGPEAPVKFTFYFQPEQLRQLDDLWLRAKMQYRARINKSEFVRLALDRLIEEFEREPQQVLEALTRHRG